MLRLTDQAGGQALIGVAWKILALDGSEVFESSQDSPRAILAEGTYQAVATHGGNSYRSSFQIKPGEETVVEIATR